MNLFSKFQYRISFIVVFSCVFLFSVPARAQSRSSNIASRRVNATSLAAGTDSIGAEGPAIIIDPHNTLRPISKYIYGFNSESALTQPASSTLPAYIYDRFNNTFNSKLVREVRKAHITIMRYPAGTPSNKFNWKQAIGPQDQRGCFDVYWNTTPMVEAYGPIEGERFAHKIGADGLDIVVNENTMAPQDAADWVEYMNAPVGANPNGGKDWAKVRTAGGHPAPYHVKWWEVGNETHGNMTWTSGIPSDKRAKAYAFGGTSTFSNQMVGKPCNHIPANSLSDGTPSQIFAVYYPPVKPGSLTLTVDGKRWTRTNNLASAGPNEQVYEVVDSTGKIIFGNDTDGAIPPKLAQIRVSYTSGPHAGYVDFYQAMKKVDPHIRVCWGTEHMDYGVLGGKYPVDCVEDHLYSGNPPASVHSDVSWHDAMMHKADVKGAKVIHHQATLKKLYPHANIVATEYGLLNSLKYTAYGKHHQTYKRGYLYSLDDGLYAGSMLIDFISAGIPLVNSENLAGGMEPYPGDPRAGAKRWRFFGLSAFGFYPHYLPQALGYVVSMFSNLMGPNQVTAKIINNPRRIPANADNKPYAVFRVVASKGNNSKYLTLIVVNRDPKRDITASIQTKQYKHRGTATVWTVNGRSVTAFNDPTHPKAVRLVKDQVQIGKGVFEYTFPAHSATAIRLVSRQ